MRNNEDRFGTKQELHDSVTPQTGNENALGINFIVPTELVDLPSKGKFYPKDHPLYLKDAIEIRHMTAKEEDILTSKSLLKKGVALDKLIESLVVDKHINTETLTIEDRNAIVVAARISGYGPEYITTVSCPSCMEKTKYSFNLLEKLPKEEVEETPEEVITLDDGTFELSLPATKWKVVVRALNGADEKTMLRLTELKKKSSNDSILLDQLKMMVVSIQGVTDKAVLEKAISMMPAADSKALRKMYSRVVTPVDLRQAFICTKCDYEADMEVPLTADFFWFK